MAYNPYGVQYGQGQGFGQGQELMPNLIRLPPPEELRAQKQQTWNKDVAPLLRSAYDFWAPQVTAQLFLKGLTGMSAPGLAVYGAGKLLANPRVQAGIGALEHTRYGRPVVENVRTALSHPYVQKVKEYADWIF